MRSTTSILAWITLGLVTATTPACRNETTTDLPDLKKAPGDMSVTTSMDDMTGGGGGDMSKAYVDTTIAAMRMAAKAGPFRLTGVVTIGQAGSKTSAKTYVQDAAGGDFSAMLLRCSTNSKSHPCAVSNTIHGITIGNLVTITGTYIHSSMLKTEDFYVDTVTDMMMAGTQPPHAMLVEADIARSQMKTAQWFQHADVIIVDPLKMYDWSPAEFKNSTFAMCTSAPLYFGWGMIPSTAMGTAGMSCNGGMVPPAGQTMVNPAEILIGTDFFADFKVSSDCMCAATFKNKVPTTNSVVAPGKISGFVNFDSASGTGYQFFSPDSDAGFPITATM